MRPEAIPEQFFISVSPRSPRVCRMHAAAPPIAERPAVRRDRSQMSINLRQVSRPLAFHLDAIRSSRATSAVGRRTAAAAAPSDHPQELRGVQSMGQTCSSAIFNPFTSYRSARPKVSRTERPLDVRHVYTSGRCVLCRDRNRLPSVQFTEASRMSPLASLKLFLHVAVTFHDWPQS